MSDPPLDPDVFYQPEGLLIMTSAYQGLLRYVPESIKLPFDSAAAKTSFQRRIDMAAGPSYMLADVKDVQTPDPADVRRHPHNPVAPFLDYLASPYGPLMTNPTAVAQHTNAPVNLLGCSVADLHNTVAARKSYSNWNSQPAWMWDTDFCTLKFKG